MEILKQKRMGFSRVNLEWMAMPPFSDFKTWNSLDGKHRVIIIRRGGKASGERRIEQIGLFKKSEISFGWQEIMEATKIITEENQVEKWVSLSVRDDIHGNHITPRAEYFGVDGIGILLPYTSFSSPKKKEEHEKMPYDEFYALYRREQAINGIRERGELPSYIDIEKTVEKFIDQINRRDFSQPVLVARSVSREEIKNIDMITRKKYDNKK